MEQLIPWWGAAIISSIALAAYLTINQHFNIKGRVLMVYRGVVLALVCIPFMFFVEPIKNINFYIIASLIGLSIAYIDNRFINASSKFGGEVTSSFQPLTVVVSFVIWWFIKPAEFFELSEDLYRFLGICSCLLLSIISFMLIIKRKFSLKALKYLSITFICIAVGDVFMKILMGMGREELLSAIVYYTFLTGLFSGLPNLYLVIKNGNTKLLFNKKSISIGTLVVLFITLVVGAKAYAMAYADNPAYVSMIVNGCSFWVVLYGFLYNRISKNYKFPRANPVVLLLFVLSAVGLIYLTP